MLSLVSTCIYLQLAISKYLFLCERDIVHRIKNPHAAIAAAASSSESLSASAPSATTVNGPANSVAPGAMPAGNAAQIASAQPRSFQEMVAKYNALRAASSSRALTPAEADAAGKLRAEIERIVAERQKK
jgi:hypothetical protein